MASHSSILPGEFHEQRSLAGNGPEGRRVGHNGATFTFNFIVIYLLCALIMPSEIIEITVTAELLDPQEHTWEPVYIFSKAKLNYTQLVVEYSKKEKKRFIWTTCQIFLDPYISDS